MNQFMGRLFLHGSLNAFSKTIMAKILVKGKMMQRLRLKTFIKWTTNKNY